MRRKWPMGLVVLCVLSAVAAASGAEEGGDEGPRFIESSLFPVQVVSNSNLGQALGWPSFLAGSVPQVHALWMTHTTEGLSMNEQGQLSFSQIPCFEALARPVDSGELKVESRPQSEGEADLRPGVARFGPSDGTALVVHHAVVRRQLHNVSSMPSALYIAPPGTEREDWTQLHTSPPDVKDAAWMPGFRNAVVMTVTEAGAEGGRREHRLAILDVSGRTLREIGPPGLYSASVSPDGRVIYATGLLRPSDVSGQTFGRESNTGEIGGVFAVDVSSGNTTQLYAMPVQFGATDNGLAISPDGVYLVLPVVAAERLGGGEYRVTSRLMIARTDGSAWTYLTDVHEGMDSGPDWSPGGSYLCYSEDGDIRALRLSREE